jgi:putative glutamine amidotransferase
MKKILLSADESLDSRNGAKLFVISKQYAEDSATEKTLYFSPVDIHCVDDYAQFADELVLTNGPDIHKAWYGGCYDSYKEMGFLSTSRDEFEIALARAFDRVGKPVSGIGRGKQVLEVARRRPVEKETLKIQKKPTVLIAGAAAYDRFSYSPAVMVNKTYTTAFTHAGAVPLLALGNPRDAKDYAMACDGLVLTGSAKFAPLKELYEKLQKQEEPLRDQFDEAIYWAFCNAEKPVFGICLGLQMINCYEGGTVLDNFRFRDGIEHMFHAHTVSVEKGCILQSLFGKTFKVNSRHFDKIEELAPTLKATTFSPDGVIEAIEHRTLPVFATQWHPERQRGENSEPQLAPDMTPLLEWFVDLCKTFAFSPVLK